MVGGDSFLLLGRVDAFGCQHLQLGNHAFRRFMLDFHNAVEAVDCAGTGQAGGDIGIEAEADEGAAVGHPDGVLGELVNQSSRF